MSTLITRGVTVCGAFRVLRKKRDGLGIALGREQKAQGITLGIHRSIQGLPLSIDLDVGLVDQKNEASLKVAPLSTHQPGNAFLTKSLKPVQLDRVRLK